MPDSITVKFGGDATDFQSTVDKVERGAKALGASINDNSKAMGNFAAEGKSGLEGLAESAEKTHQKMRALRALFEFGGLLFAIKLMADGFKSIISYAEENKTATDANTQAMAKFGQEAKGDLDAITDKLKALGVQIIGPFAQLGEAIGDQLTRAFYGDDVVDQFNAIADAADASEKKARAALKTRAEALGIVTGKEWDGLKISEQWAKINEKSGEVKKKLGEDEKKTQTEINKLLFEQLPLQDKIAQKQKEYDEAAKAYQNSSGTSGEKANAELAMLNAQHELADLKDKQDADDKKSDDEKNRAQTEQNRLLDEAVRKHDEIKAKIAEEQALQEKANESLQQAMKNYATANRDRTNRSLDEIAKGGDGILPEDRDKARRVLELDEKAKRDESHSSKVGDANDRLAFSDLAQADKLRLQIRGLDSKDKDPMATDRAAIAKAATDISAIAVILQKLESQLEH